MKYHIPYTDRNNIIIAENEKAVMIKLLEMHPYNIYEDVYSEEVKKELCEFLKDLKFIKYFITASKSNKEGRKIKNDIEQLGMLQNALKHSSNELIISYSGITCKFLSDQIVPDLRSELIKFILKYTDEESIADLKSFTWGKILENHRPKSLKKHFLKSTGNDLKSYLSEIGVKRYNQVLAGEIIGLILKEWQTKQTDKVDFYKEQFKNLNK